MILAISDWLGAVQVNIFVNSIFASHDPGAVSWLDYAFRLLYLPTGLFGVAIGTIAMSGLARRAAEGDMEGLRTTLRQSLSLLAYLTRALVDTAFNVWYDQNRDDVAELVDELFAQLPRLSRSL